MLLYQVNRILSKPCVLHQFVRNVHNSISRKVLYPLENRRLLKIEGSDASLFLQGLITNDMRHFEEGCKSMYAMFLNNKGRVLYDTLIHKWEGDDSFMIECDKNVLNSLQKHLKLFKLRRKVNVEDVNENFKIWVLMSSNKAILDSKIDSKSNINIYKDPRLIDLGFRVLSVASLNGPQVAQTIDKDITFEDHEEEYKYLRYKLGVSEGSEDLPPTSCFPLEVNCDYLHGVSFHKGCYIGQELTARVHHTGVIRKRIMPLKFTEEVKTGLETHNVIIDGEKPKSNIGKLKGVTRNYGLGLLRINEALSAKTLKIGDYSVEVIKPNWWPVEAPKEKVSTVKVE